MYSRSIFNIANVIVGQPAAVDGRGQFSDGIVGHGGQFVPERKWNAGHTAECKHQSGIIQTNTVK